MLKRNEKTKRIIALGLTTIVISGIIPGTKIVDAKEGVKKPIIAPMPQEITMEDSAFSITDNVNILGEEVADKDAIRELKETLKKKGININKEYKSEDTTIIIGEKDDNLDSAKQVKEHYKVESVEEKEGYALVSKSNGVKTLVEEIIEKEKIEEQQEVKEEEKVEVKEEKKSEIKEESKETIKEVEKEAKEEKKNNTEIKENEKVKIKVKKVEKNVVDPGVILLEGADNKGTFYAVQTLNQIIEKKTIFNTVIRDYPTQHVRAIVEGFYGNPYSHNTRLNLFDYYGQNKLNMYIYAPKDDIYHRDKWREPYPASEMGRMKELIETAESNKVDFVFAISPGKDIDINSEKDYQALIKKCEAMYDMGVRSFAILWDDIFTDDGLGQAKIMNRFNKEFVKGKEGVRPVITVPTQYWASVMKDDNGIKKYTKEFAENLDTDIEVMWTGQDVMSQGVSLEDAQWVNNIYNRKMLLWWNYPVNDYNKEKMALGPIYNLEKNLEDKIGGFIMNPMEFAEASKITVHTGAEYAWNTKNYNHNTAWLNSIENLVGNELKESFRIFANHSTRLDTGRADAPEMKAVIDKLWEKIKNKQNINNEVTLLKGDFSKIKVATNELKNKLDTKLLQEIKPQIEKLGIYANAGEHALDMIVAMLEGNSKEWWNVKSKLTLEIAKLDKIKAQISNEVLDKFIKDANSRTDEMYFDSIAKEEKKLYNYKASVSENLEPLTYTEWYNNKTPYELKNMFDGDYNTAYMSSGNVKANDEIAIDLGKIEDINNIYMLMGRDGKDNLIMNGDLMISTDNKNWETLEEDNSFREVFVNTNGKKARYIKYKANKNSENRVFIREFEVNKDTFSGIRTNTENKIDYKKYMAEGKETHAVIGTSGKLKAGEYIELELPDYKFITNVVETSKGQGKIEYSINGMDWKDVNEIKDVDVAKKVKFIAKEEINLKNFRLEVKLEGKETQSITTDRKGSGNYKDVNAIIDGDLDSSFISSGQLLEGNYFTLDLGKVTNVRNLQYIGDNNYGGDRIREGKIEYSIDGSNWTKLYEGNIAEKFRMHDLDFNAKFIKITATNHTDAWVRTSDISINSPVAEVEFQGTINPIDDNHRLPNLNDGNIQTSYIPKREVKKGDKIVYNLFNGQAVNKIEIFQSEQTISNAKVTARTEENKEIELGKLSTGYNMFKISNPEIIKAITVEFENGMGKPEIYEIVTENFNEVEIVEKANKLIKEGEVLLKDTTNKGEAVVKNLKENIESLREIVKEKNNKNEMIRKIGLLEKSIKAYKDNIELPLIPLEPSKPIKPEQEKPEPGKPGTDGNEPKPDGNGSGGSIKPGGQGNDSKPETGDTSALPLLGSGILAGIGAFLIRKKKIKK